MTEKKKNPLFVVSSDGQDVEEVGGPWEFIMSKLGLRPYFAFLEQFFEQYCDHAKTPAPMFSCAAAEHNR